MPTVAENSLLVTNSIRSTSSDEYRETFSRLCDGKVSPCNELAPFQSKLSYEDEIAEDLELTKAVKAEVNPFQKAVGVKKHLLAQTSGVISIELLLKVPPTKESIHYYCIAIQPLGADSRKYPV